MSFNVRLFGYSGIIQVGQSHAQQYSGDAVFLNEEPCLWSQLLVCDGSTVATSARITTVPDGTQMVCVEVPDNHEIRYEVVQPGVAARAVSSDSRRGSGSFNLAWSPGYTLSIIDAVPVVVAPPVAGDPHIGNVVLLMGFEGANGSTGAPGMTDESPAAHGTATVTNASISTSLKPFGSSSCFFGPPGLANGVLTFPNSPDWQLGSAQFTIDMWIRGDTSVGGFPLLLSLSGAAGQRSWTLFIANQKLCWNTSTDGTANTNDILGFSSVNFNGAGNWLALDFDGFKYRTYIDGVTDGSFSTPRTLFNSTAVLAIGANYNNSSSNYGGYLKELRLTKGFARYASDVGCPVPTAAFPRV